VVARRDDVLTVPNAALRFRPPGGDGQSTSSAPGSGAPAARPPAEKRPGAGTPTPGVVWVPGRDGRPAGIPVTLGITDGTSTEVLEGSLSEGQAILIGLEPVPAAAPARGGPGLRL